MARVPHNTYEYQQTSRIVLPCSGRFVPRYRRIGPLLSPNVVRFVTKSRSLVRGGWNSFSVVYSTLIAASVNFPRYLLGDPGISAPTSSPVIPTMSCMAFPPPSRPPSHPLPRLTDDWRSLLPSLNGSQHQPLLPSPHIRRSRNTG